MAVSWKNKHKTRTGIYHSAQSSQQTTLEADAEKGHKNDRGMEHLHDEKRLRVGAVQPGEEKKTAGSWETLLQPFNTYGGLIRQLATDFVAGPAVVQEVMILN